MTNSSNISENIKIIKYFIKEINKISGKFIPTLILTSFIRSINPFIIIIMPKYIIDELIGKQRINILITLIMLTIVLNLVFSVINRYFDKVTQIQNENVIAEFYSNIGKKVMEIDFQNIEDPTILKQKEAALFAINYQQAISQMIYTITGLLNNLIMMIGLAYIISTLNILIIVLIISIVIINSYLYKKIQEIQYINNMEIVEVNRHFGYYANLSLDFSFAKDVRLFNMRTFLMNKIIKSNKILYDKAKKGIEKTSILSGLNVLNIELQNFFTYLYLAFMVINMKIGIGSFTMYFSATNNLSSAISDIINNIITINQLTRYLNDYKTFCEIPNTYSCKKGLVLDKIDKIELKNVSFKYPKANNYSLNNINLCINKGEKLSIVGLNGAGKTTLIKLIARLYKPTEGEILVNGINIVNYEYDSYIKKISVIFQDFKLLSFSIKENIVFDSESTKEDKKIVDILESLNFKEDLMKLEKGIYTCIYKNFDSDGIEFSGGQSQKIAMARAVYRESDVLILDEPTAALDPISESEIYSNFKQITKDKTTIFISHRLASCKICDNIVVLDDGNMVQYGKHDDLISDEEGLYRKMYSLQVKQYIS